jgi:hypothetical protein
MTKVININGQRFVLPAGMAAKDIQALAGFLLALVPVEADYDYDRKEYLYSPADRGAQVQLETLDLIDRATARTQSTQSYDRYLDNKKKAEAAAA